MRGGEGACRLWTIIVVLFSMTLLSPVFTRSDEPIPHYSDTADALEALRDCGSQATGGRCSDYAAEYLEKRFWSGDKEVLSEIMQVTPFLEGHIDEEVSIFLSEVLQKEPRLFLTVLSKKKPSLQREVAFAAAYEDGSGMADDVVVNVLGSLLKYEKQPDLSSVVAVCREAILAAQVEGKEYLRKIQKDEVCPLCPPPAPLGGHVISSACNIGALLVDIGTRGLSHPINIKIVPTTVMIRANGERIGCEGLGRVFIWPEAPYAPNTDGPVVAAVILQAN